MILREATEDDLAPLHDLCRKVWDQLGIAYDTSVARFRDLRRTARIVVLYDSLSLPEADGEAMPAALIATPIETDRGPGYEIKAFVVDQELADKTRLLDALSLYAMNIAASDGRYVVVSRRPRRIPGSVFYGRDLLGMEAHMGDDAYVHQIGHAPDMMRRILERRPEWRISL